MDHVSRLYVDPDVVVFGHGGVQLIRNDTETPDKPKFLIVDHPGMAELTDVTTGVMIDFNHDGDLDLVFSSAQGVTLWQSKGDFLFDDMSQWSQLPPARCLFHSMVAVDWDRDGDIDIITADDKGKQVGLLENFRHGRFRWTETLATGSTHRDFTEPKCAVIAELDGNVSWDLLLAGPSGLMAGFSVTPHPGVVNWISFQELTSNPLNGCVPCDLDNDAVLDIVAWGPGGGMVFRGSPEGTYREVAFPDTESGARVRFLRCVDLDCDGDQDLILVKGNNITLLRNETTGSGHFISVYAIGVSSNRWRVNCHAIGSTVELRAAGTYQARLVDALPQSILNRIDEKCGTAANHLDQRRVPYGRECCRNRHVCERMEFY